MLNRRQVVQGAVATAGLLTVGGTIDALGQIDATPPAGPDLVSVTVAGETVVDRAFALDYDLNRIFRFVAEEIHYEGYDGALRGAQGALWARAGNSADQAALLVELLMVSQIPCRFAFGTLTPDGVARLVAVATPDADAVRATYDSALMGSIEKKSTAEATRRHLTPEQQEIVDLVLEQAAAIQDRAASLVEASTPVIVAALERAGVVLPELPSPVSEMERTRHVWVQVADGPSWIDVDAVVPDASPGDTLADLESTSNALPDDLHHRVRITLVAEEVSSGSLSRRNVLTFESPSVDLLNTPIALTMTGRDDLGDVGLTITDLFQGTVSLVPCLIAGNDIMTATTSIVFGSKGGGAIGALSATDETGLVDGETLAIWLVADVTTPSGATQTIERALLDRIGYAPRMEDAVDLTAVTPATLVTDTDGVTTVAELAGLTIISVDLARLPSLYATRDARSAELLGDLYLFGSSFTALRTSLGFEHELSAGYQSYPSGPSLSALSVRLVDPADDGAGIEVASDLLLQQHALVHLPDTSMSSGASPHIRAAVLDQVAEQVLVEPLVTTVDDAVNVVSPTVGMVFVEAERAGIAIVVLTSPDELAGLSHGVDALARIRSAIESGQVVVVPESPVSIGGDDVTGWWLVDPLTGRVRDVMENGRGYAGGVHAFQPAGGYRVLLNNVRLWAAPYTALGRCLAIVAAAAVRAADYSGTNGPGSVVIDTLKNVNPSDTKGCFK